MEEEKKTRFPINMHEGKPCYIYIATKVDNKKYPKHDFHHNNQQRILRVYLLIGDFHTKSHAKMEITYRKLHNSPFMFRNSSRKSVWASISI